MRIEPARVGSELLRVGDSARKKWEIDVGK